MNYKQIASHGFKELVSRNFAENIHLELIAQLVNHEHISREKCNENHYSS